MTIQDLKDNNLILLECLSGSRAYGLATPSSDTDIKGVFLLPKADFYAGNYIPQVSNASNDIVYYELGRFMELLAVNNPNILELLNTPKAAIRYKHPYLEAIDPSIVLSKQCQQSFGKFALSQIKKARGLKKKIVNPMEKERKSVLAFCYVNYDHGSINIERFLALKGWRQEDCGLVKTPNMKGVYGLYHAPEAGLKGIAKHRAANEISLSSIPKGLEQQALLYFNQDGYSKYCKDYKEYWNWVEQRNEARYQSTQNHGKNYDAKNMMHTFRLLEMAIEIAQTHQVQVARPDRDFLLKVKAGAFEYDELLALATEKQTTMKAAFEASSLPEVPNVAAIQQLTFQLRQQFYDAQTS